MYIFYWNTRYTVQCLQTTFFAGGTVPPNTYFAGDTLPPNSHFLLNILWASFDPFLLKTFDPNLIKTLVYVYPLFWILPISFNLNFYIISYCKFLLSKTDPNRCWALHSLAPACYYYYHYVADFQSIFLFWHDFVLMIFGTKLC